MKFRNYILLTAIALSAGAPAFAHKHTARSQKSHAAVGKHSAKHSSRRSSKRSAKPRLVGQRAIDDQRATQIQAALIQKGYLTGEPTGHWDDRSEVAMKQLQADHGWQTKIVPDSRAIIQLGLGPASQSASVTPAPGTPHPAGSTVPPNQ